MDREIRMYDCICIYMTENNSALNNVTVSGNGASIGLSYTGGKSTDTKTIASARAAIIRDTDMAKEMVKFSTQGVLSLLQ
ncbi:MAG: hypothetical protein IJ641_01450 [Lachnospiraceae bacterium]|nr:hypothetical protein [Lachnospiraceae bacterium]